MIKDSAESLPETHNVDFYLKPEASQERGFENGGEESYVISPVDAFDKYSKKFFNCTGLIIAGRKKGTDKNVSFMSHQNPHYFLLPKGLKFSGDLERKVQEIKEQCDDGTIDAVIVGGSYAEVKEIKAPDPNRNMYIEEYIKSINFLSEIVEKELGFEPLVITGPKTIPAGDSVFYDNENRKLLLTRGADDFGAVQSFMPSELEERRKSWKPGE